MAKLHDVPHSLKCFQSTYVTKIGASKCFDFKYLPLCNPLLLTEIMFLTRIITGKLHLEMLKPYSNKGLGKLSILLKV